MPGFELSEETKEKMTTFDMIARLSMMLKEAVEEASKLDEEVGIIGHALHQAEQHLEAQKKVVKAKEKIMIERDKEIQALKHTISEGSAENKRFIDRINELKKDNAKLRKELKK